MAPKPTSSSTWKRHGPGCWSRAGRTSPPHAPISPAKARFPERAALNQLGGRFLTDFYVTVARWVHWATEIVDGWPDDVRDTPFDVEAAQEGVDLAESIDVLLRSPTPR